MNKTILASASIFTAFMAAGGAFASNGVPNYDHIVLVVEENHTYNQIIGNSSMPYLNSLATGGALFTQSSGTEHPSQPNYLDLFSGSDQGVYGDYSTKGIAPLPADNLGAELLHNGKTFVNYSEALPSTGSTVDFASNPNEATPKYNDYARKHNAAVDFQSNTTVNASNSATSNLLPTSANQTFDAFTNTQFANLPNVSFVIPDQQNDGHGVGVKTGNALLAASDQFLQNNLGGYASWAKTHNSLLIVTYDENDFSPGNNRIATVFYGADIIPGQYAENQFTTQVSTVDSYPAPEAPVFVSTPGISHYDVLRTIEQSQGTGFAGGSANANTITDVFAPQALPTPEPKSTASLGVGFGLLGLVALFRRKALKKA